MTSSARSAGGRAAGLRGLRGAVIPGGGLARSQVWALPLATADWIAARGPEGGKSVRSVGSCGLPMEDGALP